ncbi:ABC transporter permease [Halorussus salinisoli]|uniref:ABC transporter permease n=1 Tax=Halorussus salinisoli TaxID=2558242 RepID=UPI0010C1F3A0|nr:ABC transporter permease [Halorussus salinisoli]
MKKYIIKRLGSIFVTLLVLSFIIFALTQMLPGNTAKFILGKFATPERMAVLEQQLGLNRPWYVQYVDWLTGFVTGDWGTSFRGGETVDKLVIPKAIHSFQLAVLTLVTVVLISIPFGILGAVTHGSLPDRLVLVLSYLGISIPTYVSGTMLLLLFGGPMLSVFPAGGYVPLREGVVPWLQHMALPVLSLVILLTAHLMSLTRVEMIETLHSDYVRTARLKGLSELTVLGKHALRNSLLPTITLLALDLGFLMGGIVVIEEIFAFPGLGRLIVHSIRHRDLPVIQMSMLIVAIVYTLSNFAADLLYAYLNPRIDYE